MFVTNLTNDRLGINGVVNLAPREVNLYVNDKDLDLVDRVVRLEAAKLVSVVRESGLVKTGITGKVIKTVGAQHEALSPAPRTPGVEVESKVAIETQEEVANKTVENTETAEEIVEEEVAPIIEPEAPVEEAKEEAVAVEKPAKKSRKAKVAEAVAKATEM